MTAGCSELHANETTTVYCFLTGIKCFFFLQYVLCFVGLEMLAGGLWTEPS